MNRSQKRILTRIVLAALLLVAAILIPAESLWLELLIYLVPYLVVSYDVVWKAVRGISRGQLFDENFLMAIATIGALVIGEYTEAVFVMLFYQIGELFEKIAVGKSRRSIAALMDIRPDYANLEQDGELVEVDPEEVPVGSIIVVKPGERIPLDGVVEEGSSSLNTVALTGEALPRDVAQGDEVISGCINLSGLLRIRTTHTFGESTVSKILDLVENSSSCKARTEVFITRFARYYTPLVVIAALVVAVIPPLFLGDWSRWVHQALVFLVISCPCALVLSVPLSFFGGLGGASRSGILVKGSNYLEILAQTQTVVFDKTGTLTKGTFSVTSVQPESGTEENLLELAALAESYSSHPIAVSLRDACGSQPDRSRVGQVDEISGHGVRAVIDGKTVLLGSQRLMEQEGIAVQPCDLLGTVIYVAADGVYQGAIVISDTIKEDAPETIRRLKERGIRTVMLTGDRKAVGEAVAKELGIDQVYTELLPEDKVNKVKELLAEKTGNGKLAFVGDGINDAPVLAHADLGIAMGAMGSDAAIEAADVVLMEDKPLKLIPAMEISRSTNRIVLQNIVFVLGVKAVVLGLGLFGMANLWEAVFADVGVLVIAVLNAMRGLKAQDAM